MKLKVFGINTFTGTLASFLSLMLCLCYIGTLASILSLNLFVCTTTIHLNTCQPSVSDAMFVSYTGTLASILRATLRGLCTCARIYKSPCTVHVKANILGTMYARPLCTNHVKKSPHARCTNGKKRHSGVHELPQGPPLFCLSEILCVCVCVSLRHWPVFCL